MIKVKELYDHVGFEDGWFGRYYNSEEGKDFYPYGRKFWIKSIINIWDAEEYLFVLETDVNGKRKSIVLPRKNLTKTELIKFSGSGFDFFDHTYTTVIELLQKLEAKFKKKDIAYQHEGLGWTIYNNRWVFRGSEINEEQFKSTYNGDFNIKPKGSFNAWLNMINSCVIGNTPLEFALAVGFTSVLIGRMGLLLDNESLFIHFCGESSSGKTTAAYLMASVAGSPNIQDDGLLRTWNSTTNAAMKTLVNNFGYPMIFDEFSMRKETDVSSLIYMLTSGREKSRMKKDRSLQKTESFRTTIVSTGEVSILNKCNGNTGLEMRLLEVNNVAFTPDSKTAEKIKKVCSANYGHAINKFAKFVSNQNLKSFENGLEHYRQKFIYASCVKDKYTERLSKKFAIILLTAHYVRKVFSLKIDITKLLDFLVDVERTNSMHKPRNIVSNAYEDLLQFVETNKSQFVGAYVTSNNSCWGKINKSNLPDEVAYQIFLPTNKFDWIFKKNLGYEDTRVIVNGLKENGYLDCDKDHNTRKRKLTSGGNPVRCYIVNVLKDDSPEDDGEQPE